MYTKQSYQEILPRNWEWFPYGLVDTAKIPFKVYLDSTRVRFPYGITPHTGAWPGGKLNKAEIIYKLPKQGLFYISPTLDLIP